MPGTLAHLAMQIRDRRKALGLSQLEVAELADCSPRFLRALETGKRTVRLDKLLGVLDALGLTCRIDVRRSKVR